MNRYTVEIATMVYVSVDVDAEDEDEARDAVLYGDALPWSPVRIEPTRRLPPSAGIWIDNKGWEINSVEPG